MLNRQGRPTRARRRRAMRASADDLHRQSRPRSIEEPLIFEIGRADTTGVDLDEPEPFTPRLGGLERTRRRSACPASPSPRRCATTCGCPRRTTPSTPALFPLGSCTMKHNPRLNEKMARLPGFADIHPLQPVSTVQGALELIDELARWLLELTGMPAVAHDAQGRRAWRALRHDGDQGRASRRAGEGATRRSCWCRNPPTAPTRPPPRCIGFTVEDRPGARRRHGRSRGPCKPLLGPDVAAIMLTNPNTCGLFERDVVEIADGDARGRRLLLLRRRQLQRHRRQGAARRSRRRRHAHQPAQDLLDAAWRRRARAPGPVVLSERARALRAGARS